MKIFSKIAGLLIVLTLTLGFSSCMNMDLDDLPTYSDAQITGFNFEYRYTTAVGTSGEKLQVRSLSTTTSIDSEKNVVTCSINVPSAYGTFTDAEKAKVSLSNIVGIASISAAAMITPKDGAPVLGQMGNYSEKSYQYTVEAANGEKKVWTLIISAFTNN